MVIVGLFCLAGAAIAEAAPDVDSSTPQEWLTAGKRWQVKLTQYSRMPTNLVRSAPAAEEQRAKLEFEMTISVLPPLLADGRRLARFEFAPSKDAPPEVAGQKYLLAVDVASGRADSLKLVEGRYPGSFAIEPAGDERVLLTDLFGFPADWILQNADLSEVSGAVDRSARIDNTQVVLTKSLSQVTVDHDRQAMKMDLTLPDSNATGPSKRVVQTWVPGESWWRTFQRYRGGRIDLEARLVSTDGGS
jgi:hypothetical protein